MVYTTFQNSSYLIIWGLQLGSQYNLIYSIELFLDL